MPSEGPNYPGTVGTESIAPENAGVWTDPANIGADDGAVAVVTGGALDQDEVTDRLNPTNFGFSIPAGAIIDGIVVEIERSTPAASEALDFRVQLRSGGVLVGNNKADTVNTWPTSPTIATYGGAADLWGWTPDETDINDTTFGVTLSVEADDANSNPAVDFIRVTVHYTEGGGGPQNVSVTPATETDTAQPLEFTKTIHKTLIAAAETEQAQALSVTKTIFKSVTPAQETDTAQPLSVSQAGGQNVSITPATEGDTAQPLSFHKVVALSPVVESDTAQPLSVAKLKTLIAATETDTALALFKVKRPSITPALEANTVQPLIAHKAVSITPATETDQAQALLLGAIASPVAGPTKVRLQETGRAKVRLIETGKTSVELQT